MMRMTFTMNLRVGEESEDAQDAVWDRFFNSNLPPNLSQALLTSDQQISIDVPFVLHAFTQQ